MLKIVSNPWRKAVGKTTPTIATISGDGSDDLDGSGEPDIERFDKDQIAKFLKAKYSGHAMAELVEPILIAKGFHIYRSPEGPDKGVDLLAAPGELGFQSPKLCVQVKTGDTPVDRPTMDQLIGAMQNFGAESGLLVSWAGFKSSVDKEIPSQFFRVRLWDQDTLIEELLACYDQLDEDLKSELPLKRVWTIVQKDPS